MEHNKALNPLINLQWHKYRPLAFFGIKAHESHESVRDWVKWCKQQGFGGFNIIIASECIGRANERWIDMVMLSYEVALKAAKEEGLEVWIFDDWGYPSGTAGGLVCLEPSFRQKKLQVSHDCTLKAGERISLCVPEHLVSAGILVNKIFHRLHLEPGQIVEYTAQKTAERIVIVSWEYDDHQAKSSCKSYPGDPAMSCIDLLNPRATQRFLEVMHEEYFKRFSGYFGTVIKGFFYDEPYVSFAFPWTENLPSVFQKKKGYDVQDFLPLLMIQTEFLSSDPIKKYADDFFDVWTDMAAENFYGKLSRWCFDHSVELTGHMDLEHHLNTMSTVSGHFFKNMYFSTRPAVDVIWAQIEPGVFTDFPRYAGSVKRLLGRKHAVSETFAGMGQGLNGDLMRYITDHQTIRGIDQFHLMYSNNSPSEPAESVQMPNHMLQEPFGKIIYERMARASAIAALGTSAATTAIYLPAFDLYRVQLGLSELTINNAEKLPWEWVNEIALTLTYMPCDYDYIWDAAVLSLPLASGGLLAGCGHIINTIILPPDCTLKETVVQRLKVFCEVGGKIVSVFRTSPHLGEEAQLCSELDDLKHYVQTTVSIPVQNRISLCTRLLQDKTVYMLLNESTKEANVDIRIHQEGNVHEYSLQDGTMLMVSNESCAGFSTRFEAGQMKVFVTDATMTGQANAIISCDKGIQPVNWSIELPDSRIYDLDSVSWPDWTELGYPIYSGFMKYKACFEWNFEEQNALISIPGLHYHAIVSIDGKEAGRLAYKPYELRIDGLCMGSHVLELAVYNTGANEVCGTFEVERERYSKRFAHMAAHDRKRLKSGITEPIIIYRIS